MRSPVLPLVLLSIATTTAQGQNQTVTSLSAVPASANMGQAVTLTASVSPPDATGKVTFYDGAAILGVAPVANGVATLVTTGVSYGKRALRARYGGYGNYAGSLSAQTPEHIVNRPGGAFVAAPDTPYLQTALTLALLTDFNHDGNADLVAINNYYTTTGIQVFLGKADGTFQPAQAYLSGTWACGIATGDIDMDGNPDLIVTGPDHLVTLIGKGDGSFTTGPSVLDATDLSVIRVADVNADGRPDLVFLRQSSPAIEILLGNGDGTFQTNAPLMMPLASAAYDLLVADLSGDGFPDLLVANAGADCVTVFLGTGSGAFGPATKYTSYGASSLAMGDLNNDGNADLIVGSISPAFDVLLGNGDGTFGPARSISTYTGPALNQGAYPIAPFDFDGDGNADAIVYDAYGDVFVLMGKGDGAFRPPLQFFLSSYGGGIAAGDLNHDGIADIAGTNFSWAVTPWWGALAPAFTVAASPDPPAEGQAVTLTVTSPYPDATGTLTFTDIQGAGTPLGTTQLANGIATLNLGALSAGPHNIHGTYSGDAKYAAANLPSIYLVTQQSIGNLSFTASPNPALPGQPITLAATVPIPVGNAKIAFFDGTAPLNVQTLYSQTASFTTTLAAGPHQLSALFPGLYGFLPTSATVIENVLATPGGAWVAGPAFELSTTIGQAMAMDLNRDGLLDLAVLDPGKSQVDFLLNMGQGTFQKQTAMTLGFVPGAIVATGVDNYYGNSGFALTNPVGNAVATYQYYAGVGVVTVGAFSVGQKPVAIAAADFNGDGQPDLVTANAGSNDATLILSGISHPASVAAGNHPDSVAAGDFNFDGKADFAIANRDDNSVMVFLGNGDGTFRPPASTVVGAGPATLVPGDLNGDFETDLAAIDVSNQATILLSNGDGTFRISATYALGSTAAAAALADVTGDNKLDLVVTTAAGMLVFAGNGNGTFGSPVNYAQYAGAESLAAGAFSGEPRMDLFVTMPAAGSVTLAVNGSATAVTLSVTPSKSATSGKVTLKATISPAGATGFVSFYDGVAPIGGAPVSNSSGSFSTTLLASGTHSLSARFIGGSGWGFSTSAPVNLTVSPAPSSGLSATGRQSFPFDSPLNLIRGDFNNDGHQDFAFVRGGGGLRVILGDGNGAFQEVPPGTSAGGSPGVTADFNNDGNTDLAYLTAGLVVARGDGMGDFAESTLPGNGVSIAVSDFNTDGSADIVIADPSGTVAVLTGNGDGTFRAPASYAAGPIPVLVVTGDFNQDGRPDILAANSISGPPASGQVNFLSGVGDGSFGSPQPTSLAGVPVAMVVADFNRDGRLDAAVAQSNTDSISILLGAGDGSFAAPVDFALGGSPVQLQAADMDGDGRMDLVVMFASAAPAFAIFYGNGDGTFTGPASYADVQGPYSMAVGDVNGDGMLDVILGEPSSVSVFSGYGVALSPPAVTLDAASQTSTVGVVAKPVTTSWTASANGGFLSIISGAGGTGSGTVGFTAAANNTGAVRTGSLSFGRQTVPVTQRVTTAVFTDVLPPAYYFDFADVMYNAHISAGCAAAPVRYCPDSTTTRAEMAVFLITAIEHGNNFAYTQTPYFTDVPSSSPYFKFIQKLKDLGITGGCTATAFCPENPVTRVQMAVFVVASRYGKVPYSYPATPYFTDVPPTSGFFPFVQKMAQAQITAGCAPNLFCPNDSLTRGQMSVFIVTGLLNELLPAGTPAIAAAAPGAAGVGQTVTVALSGQNTHFAAGTTQVVTPPGITASDVIVTSATGLTVQLAVGANFVPGRVSLVAVTGAEEAVLPNGFTIQ